MAKVDFDLVSTKEVIPQNSNLLSMRNAVG
jgi:hypothetical protein